MKKILTIILAASMMFVSACSNSKPAESTQATTEGGKLKGEIVVWTSFTQGARNEFMKNAIADFMKANPEVNIKMQAFDYGEFYNKWTTGLQSGQVPDVSTAWPNQVIEMLDADALIPLDDVIDKIGRTRFYEAALNEGSANGKSYSIPLYSIAQVMWYRKDLLQKANLEIPKTWDELAAAAKKLNSPPDLYGISVPMGIGDFEATRFLNLYVRSAGETLITKDGKANLTSKAAIDGIKYWTDLYKATSPKGSVNFKVLDQATLFYQGKTALDFNTGFHIGGVQLNSPALLDQIDAAPIPKINANDPDRGIEASFIPMVVWKNSKHPEIAKAFIESLYKKEQYVKFLHSIPGAMQPALKDIVADPTYLDDPTIKKFNNAVKVISDEASKGTEIGMEYKPILQAGIITSQGVIEKMFQDIVLKNTPVEEAAKKAEKDLNDLFQQAKK